MLLQRRKARASRREAGRASPYYGYGYRPDWPSVLSVAHDPADGGRLFVLTDRPCALVNAGLVLPLEVAGEGGSRLHILAAEQVLPNKFRLTMNGAVPAGSDWEWGDGPSELIDPITGHAPNARRGTCDDLPGPYVPPPPAAVVEALAGGGTATLRFDRVIILVGPGPVIPGDAVTFDGNPLAAVNGSGTDTLTFDVSGGVGPGSAWAIARQPEWAATPLVHPASGTLA